MSDYYKRVCTNLRAEGLCQIHIPTPDEKDARIAKLEAIVDNDTECIRQLSRIEEDATARAEQAEAERDDYKAVAIDAAKDQARLTAELAALKADVWGPDERRCETCKWWDLMSEPVPDDPRFHHACVRMDDQGRVYFPSDFACNRWTERERV